MKFISICFILISLLFSCTQTDHRTNIERIQLSIKSPVDISNEKGISDTIKIYRSQLDKYAIYELPYHTISNDQSGLLNDSVTYDYFIYNTEKNWGYLLKKITDSLTVKSGADSTLKRGFGNGNPTCDPSQYFSSGTYSKIDSSQETMTYRYICPECDLYDTAYYYYDKRLRDIHFSLSAILDSIHQSKLVKMVYLVKHEKKYDSIPALKNFFIEKVEIQTAPAADEFALRNLFARFIEKEKTNTH